MHFPATVREHPPNHRHDLAENGVNLSTGVPLRSHLLREPSRSSAWRGTGVGIDMMPSQHSSFSKLHNFF